MSEVAQKPQELSDTQRMVNIGIEIELKKLGKVTVRELSLESIIKLAKPVKLIVDEFSKSGDDNLVMLLMESPSLLIALKKVAASATGRTEEDFRDMGVVDWLKVVKTFKEVMDWEEITELFFGIVPRETIMGFTKA